MNTTAFKLWLTGGIVALLGLAAVLWLVLVGPEFDSGSATRASATDAAQQNMLLQRQVDRLRTEEGQVGKLESQLAAARAAIPTGAGIGALTQELSAAAAATHVTLTSVTVGDPTALTNGGTAGNGIYTISVSVVSTGATSDQLAFLHALQYGARAALVQSAAFAPGAANGATSGTPAAEGSTLTVAMTVFVDPGSGTAAPAPAAPAAATTG